MPQLPDRPHHRFWPPRLPRSLTVPATSLWHNLATSAARYPTKPALVFFERSISYQDLAAQAEALAGALHALGLQRGERVLLFMQNCPQLVVAHFAILRANAVVVPVNPMNKAEELQHYITDADARFAITTGELAAELARASDALPAAQRLAHLAVTQFGDAFDTRGAESLLAAGSMAPAWCDWLTTPHARPALAGGEVHTWSALLSRQAPPPPHLVGAGDMALLPYTSGTTGLPKGCIHHHANLMHNAMASMLWSCVHSESVVLAVLPMFHITGIVSMLHTAIAAGATLVVMPRWDREVAGHLIATHRVTNWANIPTMVVDLLASPRLAEHDLSSLKVIGGGGAAMPQAVAQRLVEQYGLRYQEGYGLTETSAPCHLNPVDHPKQQCLGIPLISTDARIVDPDTLQELPAGESGEIIVHGPQVFHGYWKRPDATAAAFIDFEGRRYFRTGDMGRVDEDGYFFMTDRLKRMINASGFKVWPAEVELLMYKHPAIQEACIIGTRDTYRGETVKAVVVLRPTHRDTTAEEIMAWCREHMAAYKVPRLVEFVDALPKSGSGKVMWRVLQEREAAQATGT